jgi:DNA-binding MarR family transcriptional regulator
MDSNHSPAQAIVRLSRLLEKNCGEELTLAQYRMLGAIAAGSERAGRLANALAVRPPVVSERIEALVERGFVARHVPSTDRRAVDLQLTPAGREAFDGADRAIDAALQQLIDECDDPRLVRNALTQLSDAMSIAAKARKVRK